MAPDGFGDSTWIDGDLGMNFENNGASEWANGSAASVPASQAEMGAGAAPASSAKVVDEAGEKLAAEMTVFNQVAGELKSKIDASASYDSRVAYVVHCATEMFGVAPTWTAFYREVLGGDGVMRQSICCPEEMAKFECCDEHSKLLEMLTVLRSRDLPENDPHEPQRMITVRIPKSLHDAICEEANQLAVSVNKLCISRMLQKVDKSMIPSSTQKRRGRRPGSAGAKSTSSASESRAFDSRSMG